MTRRGSPRASCLANSATAGTLSRATAAVMYGNVSTGKLVR